ncbi:MAG: SDR family NAD(P)-dependent oxidoreductase [Myxococcota bacterium]|jgi:NAD(P)-dependent dehydrogenase (short-subunit alcohol dehydrogenase family)|nr:SDR family NAD(P)-dependent oxidoreductase [Myxococcota bacterium]
MTGKLEGKVAIITGAGQGVGRGIALAMAKAGARCVIADFNEESGQQVVKELEGLGGEALFVGCDVTSRASIDAAVDRTIEVFGQLDILVNNAQRAPLSPTPVMEHTDEIIDLCFDTGFRGSFRFMQAAYPHLKASRGRVINIASGAGLDGLAGQSAYGAAKEAIRALSKSAAREWGRDGINVNIICPLANSPGVATLLELAPEMEKRMTANQPLGRIGDCEEDIGPVAVFLASDDSRYVTGHTLPADGGNSMVR